MIFCTKLIYSLIILFSFCSFYSCSSPSKLEIHFIDIGQGDSTLIKYENKNILIDSGPNESEEFILEYLKKENIKKIDYLIATHPHEDHIGNMDTIIDSFNVTEFLAPKVIYESNDFKNMLKELKSKKLDIKILNENSKHIYISSDAYLEFLSPTKDSYENTNNFSPIIKLTHNNNKFLLTGDAEIEAEIDILSKDIDSDVLKVAHHGSSSSSNKKFLEKVTPSISVISCGINNKFNHPHEVTLESLKSLESKIYRTDEDGSIVLYSDGETIIKKDQKK